MKRTCWTTCRSSSNCWRSARHRAWTRRCSKGLTLIEVIAALFVLGVLLSGVLLAKGRLTGQWGDANRQFDAVAATDRLLSEWWRSGTWPVNETGSLENRWTWVCFEQSTSAESETLLARVVRLEVFADEDEEPVVRVDLLVPLEEDETSDEDDDKDDDGDAADDADTPTSEGEEMA